MISQNKGGLYLLERVNYKAAKPESFVKVKCFHFDRRIRKLPKYFLLTYLAIIHLAPAPAPITYFFCLENPVIVYHSICGCGFKDIPRWSRDFRKHTEEGSERQWDPIIPVRTSLSVLTYPNLLGKMQLSDPGRMTDSFHPHGVLSPWA